ncbi:MAG: stage V sporulation protein AB [Bacillus sp. (in: firmicutes)]
MIWRTISLLFLGLAEGLAVGAGFVAFLTVLGIIPRLTQLTKTMSKIHAYEWAVVFGVVIGAWCSLWDVSFQMPVFLLIVVGLGSGIFNGMLAAALTEVLNVWPLLAKRMRIQEKIIYLLMALVLGKVAGSLFQWLYFVDQ